MLDKALTLWWFGSFISAIGGCSACMHCEKSIFIRIFLAVWYNSVFSQWFLALVSSRSDRLLVPPLIGSLLASPVWCCWYHCQSSATFSSILQIRSTSLTSFERRTWGQKEVCRFKRVKESAPCSNTAITVSVALVMKMLRLMSEQRVVVICKSQQTGVHSDWKDPHLSSLYLHFWSPLPSFSKMLYVLVIKRCFCLVLAFGCWREDDK